MKKLILISILVISMAVPAFANPTVTVDRIGAVWDTAILGGELHVNPNQDLKDITAETGSFMSFCLEGAEGIDDTGGTTYFASVLTEAILGNGNTGPTGPLGYDALDPRSAYLYTEFRKGTLINYNNDNVSAGALQMAFWHIEEEAGWTWAALTPQAQGFVTLAGNQGWSNIGNVRVLHLWTSAGPGKINQAQDMLVMIPAPGAVLLGSIGIGLVGWLRRRRTL